MPRRTAAPSPNKPPIVTPDDAKALDAGYTYDPEPGRYVADFLQTFIRHTKSPFAGDPFIPLPWQRSLIDRLYGWRSPEGTRRFRECFLEVPKKNGKSTMIAALELLHLLADGEIGAEVYTGARDRQQAAIIYNEALAMLESAPALLRHCNAIPSSKRIVVPETRSILQALSADVGSKEGLNASFACIDEVHVQADARLYKTLRYAGAARLEPLYLGITTAGEDREHIAYTLHETSLQIAEGTLSDPSFLGIVYGASPDDDFEDPRVWHKANPSLGHTISVESFASDLKSAQRNAQDWASFLRYRLNLWLATGTRYLNAVDWQRCAAHGIDRAALIGQPCHAGLDLSAVRDLTSFGARFAGNRLLSMHWLPEADIEQREQNDRVPYRQWAAEGWLRLTPGRAVDYDHVRADILEFHARHPIASLFSDPWNATQLAAQLEAAGVPVRMLSQNFRELSEATKEIQRQTLAGEIRPGPDPVLAWCAANAIAITDGNDNVRLSKKASRSRIDAIAAHVNAQAARLAAAVAGAAGPSVYESRGLDAL